MREAFHHTHCSDFFRNISKIIEWKWPEPPLLTLSPLPLCVQSFIHPSNQVIKHNWLNMREHLKRLAFFYSVHVFMKFMIFGHANCGRRRILPVWLLNRACCKQITFFLLIFWFALSLFAWITHTLFYYYWWIWSGIHLITIKGVNKRSRTRRKATYPSNL